MKSSHLICALLGVALFVAAPVRADNTNRPAPPAPPSFRPPPPGARGLDPIASALGVLTEEQRQSMRQTMASQRERIMALQTQLRAARQDLFETALGGTFDEAAVRAKAAEVGRIESEMTVLRVKALSQVRPPLTPAQREKIRLAARGAFAPRGSPLPPGGARRHPPLTNSNRDENDLPPKP
jgi:Spy/CpxP family protein refolding chaperone